MAGTKSRDKSSNDNRSRQLNPENERLLALPGRAGPA
jgi:hypothetical protein